MSLNGVGERKAKSSKTGFCRMHRVFGAAKQHAIFGSGERNEQRKHGSGALASSEMAKERRSQQPRVVAESRKPRKEGHKKQILQ